MFLCCKIVKTVLSVYKHWLSIWKKRKGYRLILSSFMKGLKNLKMKNAHILQQSKKPLSILLRFISFTFTISITLLLCKKQALNPGLLLDFLRFCTLKEKVIKIRRKYFVQIEDKKTNYLENLKLSSRHKNKTKLQTTKHE